MAGNLLSNAIKFTPAGGRIRVDVRRAGARVHDRGGQRHRHRDAPSFLPHLFERFRQADASTTRNHSGLGLGLAITRHLAELHGGTVAAASDGPGRGATFAVSLPFAPGSHQTLSVPRTAGFDQRTRLARPARARRRR